ncbi:MAG: hypothetical protein JWO38_6651 [Gemmataceae bacterium]|nr:hypothetical protein [Gemmataceae bacterium]
MKPFRPDRGRFSNGGFHMRWHAVAFAVLFAGIGLAVAAGDTKEEAVVKDLEALKGTWAVVSADRDGKKLTAEQIKGVTFTIDGTGKALVKKGDQLLFDGTIKIDPTKKPKTVDVTQTSEGENKGKTILSIYQIEGDTLKVCSAEPGKDRPTELSSKPGSGHFLREYKREMK